MILYHGSYEEISKPDLLHSRANVDFGRGFYTTPIHMQAEKWCGKFIRRGKSGVISHYKFDESFLSRLNVLEFGEYSEAWLDFVLQCRSERDSSGYDIVIGGVANDKVFNTVELYFENLIDKKEALKRLKYEEVNSQVCFRTERAISYLEFTGSETL